MKPVPVYQTILGNLGKDNINLFLVKHLFPASSQVWKSLDRALDRLPALTLFFKKLFQDRSKYLGIHIMGLTLQRLPLYMWDEFRQLFC